MPSGQDAPEPSRWPELPGIPLTFPGMSRTNADARADPGRNMRYGSRPTNNEKWPETIINLQANSGYDYL
jgi:hypothetical protein